MFGLQRKKQVVKIRSLNETKKYGVAATSLKELLKKGSKLLQVPLVGSHISMYEDGTELTEDYFRSLPDNAELVLLAMDERWSGFVCDIGRLLDTDRNSDLLIDAAKGLLSNERSPKRRRLLGDLLLHLKDSSEAENREDDEDWFQGNKSSILGWIEILQETMWQPKERWRKTRTFLFFNLKQTVSLRLYRSIFGLSGIDDRFKTKSAYMKYNCESRIRGYMKEVHSYAQTIQKPKLKDEYKKTAECLVMQLKSDKYNGCYFNRKEKEQNRLCTQEGWFSCQGAFDHDECKSLHSINPYGNRESRILFSTWNLDHGIEKKRTVIPTLVEALQKHKSSNINLDYFYKLLFTRENLKLVHIVCHKKGAHDLLCDKRKIYKQGKRK
ncbi:DNA fragmentation factor subunit beta isoform X1 [Oncorhynchus mykiss]|uniref:DNA fragmentation factor subunit beta n=1 Tax=Oncorhynchus mykiss TaxID=8022 RepID=A0A8C7TWX7_ONCMY|nr:DNA fragmentation factor subunit beta isoform X1 [Oncorhynchus mykiss]